MPKKSNLLDQLHSEIRKRLQSKELWSDELEKELPVKWEKHGNLILFQNHSFVSDIWKAEEGLFEFVAAFFKVESLARKTGPIANDHFRSPNVELLFGKEDWVHKKENNILYSFRITKCMFSSGNISEKLRLASLDCNGETIVDLFAGIGYFTLTYLVHSKADFVYACEWNPNSIESLKLNLKNNKVEDRCKVLFGDNRELCPKDVADRVNLGLIPSCEEFWKAACLALKKSTGGFLHIHANVDEDSSKYDKGSLEKYVNSIEPFNDIKIESWINYAIYAASQIEMILDDIYKPIKWAVKIDCITKVKNYAPKVSHLVIDLHCIPNVFLKKYFAKGK